jgi:hypothetical protein
MHGKIPMVAPYIGWPPSLLGDPDQAAVCIQRDRSGDPILVINAPGVHIAVPHLTYQHARR